MVPPFNVLAPVLYKQLENKLLQPINIPPLTSITAPVMKSAASEERKLTTSPRFSGFPNFPKGIVFLIAATFYFGRLLIISVSWGPGAIAFTVMLNSASFRAMLMVYPIIPAFDAP